MKQQLLRSDHDNSWSERIYWCNPTQPIVCPESSRIKTPGVNSRQLISEPSIASRNAGETIRCPCTSDGGTKAPSDFLTTYRAGFKVPKISTPLIVSFCPHPVHTRATMPDGGISFTNLPLEL